MKLIFNILWLDVNNVNFLPTLYQIEKMKKLSMNFLSEMNDRKESEEGKNISKQMC